LTGRPIHGRSDDTDAARFMQVVAFVERTL
jgi:hypothetical protein